MRTISFALISTIWPRCCNDILATQIGAYSWAGQCLCRRTRNISIEGESIDLSTFDPFPSICWCRFHNMRSEDYYWHCIKKFNRPYWCYYPTPSPLACSPLCRQPSPAHLLVVAWLAHVVSSLRIWKRHCSSASLLDATSSRTCLINVASIIALGQILEY
jgi:hypothetical protein